MPKCEKVFVIMKWILQWKGGWHAPAVVINQHDISNRWHVTTRWSLATWPEVAAYNFLFAGKECVALEALRPVDGDEGKHVGEGGVRWAVGNPDRPSSQSINIRDFFFRNLQRHNTLLLT